MRISLTPALTDCIGFPVPRLKAVLDRPKLEACGAAGLIRQNVSGLVANGQYTVSAMNTAGAAMTY